MQGTTMGDKARRAVLAAAGAVLPVPTAAYVERLYFTPPRPRPPARELQARGDAEHLVIDGLPVYRWRSDLPWEAPRGRVLLVHGWGGRGTQLQAFIAPLLARGCEVVAFDGPAHGRAPGRDTDLLRFRAALLRIVDELGPFDGAVAHSFGCAALALALHAGLPVPRVVLVAPPASLELVAQRFSRLIGLSRPVEVLFRARVEERFGRDVWHRLSLDVLAPELTARALVVHDADDVEVPLSDGQSVAAAWRGAELKVTRGLGHRRVLRDDDVVDAAARFLWEARDQVRDQAG